MSVLAPLYLRFSGAVSTGGRSNKPWPQGSAARSAACQVLCVICPCSGARVMALKESSTILLLPQILSFEGFLRHMRMWKEPVSHKKGTRCKKKKKIEFWLTKNKNKKTLIPLIILGPLGFIQGPLCFTIGSTVYDASSFTEIKANTKDFPTQQSEIGVPDTMKRLETKEQSMHVDNDQLQLIILNPNTT